LKKVCFIGEFSSSKVCSFIKCGFIKVNWLRKSARKANKDPSKIRIFVLTYPNVLDYSSSSSAASSSKQQKLPMTGTIDQIGSDIDKIKAMDIEHIIFGHVFYAIAKEMDKMIEITKQLARFAK
jgi:hypothetical protein